MQPPQGYASGAGAAGRRCVAVGLVTVLHLEVEKSPPTKKKQKRRCLCINKNTKFCQEMKAKDVRGADFHIREQ